MGNINSYADVPSLYGDFVNQSTNSTYFQFSVTDGLQYIKNKTTNNRNAFTYYDGRTSTSSASNVSVPWFRVNDGDSVVIKLKDMQVIQGGSTLLQVYNSTKGYVTGWTINFTTDMTEYETPAKIIASGRGSGLVGMNYFLASKAEMYFRLEYWVNGVKYTGS